MDFTGERFIPGKVMGTIILEHMQRYYAAREVVKGKQVLDAACGEGYGSALLAETAENVVGIDLSAETIQHAQAKYVRANLEYVTASIAKLPFPDSFFDVVVSFETIEHVDEELQTAFLQEIKRVLKPEGLLLMSSPDKLTYSDLPGFHNEYHVKEFYCDEFRDFLHTYFTHVVLYRQGIENLSVGIIRPDGECGQHLETIGDFGCCSQEEQYIIALCSERELNQEEQVATLMHIPEQVVPALFVDTGAGFSEEQKIYATVTETGAALQACFDLRNLSGITCLRFDPVEGVPCGISGLVASSDAGQVDIEPLNAEYGPNGEYLFYTTDPMLLVTGDFQQATYLNLVYTFRVMEPVEFAARYRMVMVEKAQINSESEQLRLEMNHLRAQKEHLKNEGNLLKNQLTAIQTSRGYQLLLKYYSFRNAILPPESLQLKLLKIGVRLLKMLSVKRIFKGCKCLLRKGPTACLAKIRQVERALPYSDVAAYAQWIQENEPTEMILQEQREEAFPYEPLISIVVPAFNTQESYLREMLESLLAQTYSRWELCLADGGSAEKFQIERILAEYAAVDKRIRYRMIGKNLGIAENTNAALQLAQGDYIGLLDHDDILAPFALYEMVKSINKQNQPDFLYSDEDKFVEVGQGRFAPYFKSGFSIDMLRSFNYIGHFSVIKQALFSKIGGFNSQFDGSQDYDVVLRVVENSEHIIHIPKILYHWRTHDASVALNPGSKLYAYEAGRQAIQHHLRRVGLPGIVLDGYFLGSYQIKYAITNPAKVSIVIPSCDHVADLKKCIDSIVAKTTYADYEIIVVENNSKDSRTFAYYEALQQQERITVVKWPQTGFNFSAIVNYGVQFAQGEYILLLNNDVEVITPDWLELMVMYLQRDDVGVVGSKMYYPDDTIQHAGVFIHPTGAAGHMSYGLTRAASGYFGRAQVVQNVSAVTGACLLVKKALYEEVGGFDEQVLKVAYNDVDFCLKIRMLNKLVVFTPFAELYHYESKSRGSDMAGENYKRWVSERDAFINKWDDVLIHGDPYYNQILC